jgi:predicted TPR repeat methyltransferase
VSKPLTRRYVDGSYMEEVKGWHAGDSAWKASKILEMIERHGLTPKTVYDIGCGVGEVLVELQRCMPDDVTFRGYDISPQATSIAREKQDERLEFLNEDFLVARAAPPDLLLLLDVFEHVPDYLGFLEALKDRARWFIFHIPIDLSVQSINHRSATVLEKRRKYGHLHAFTRDMALATLADTGYEVVDHFYTNDHEIDNRPPSGLRPGLVYRARRWLFRRKPDLAVWLFASFNCLVLARPADRV